MEVYRFRLYRCGAQLLILTPGKMVALRIILGGTEMRSASDKKPSGSSTLRASGGRPALAVARWAFNPIILLDSAPFRSAAPITVYDSPTWLIRRLNVVANSSAICAASDRNPPFSHFRATYGSEPILPLRWLCLILFGWQGRPHPKAG
jgi:hypothetical protein